MLLRKSLLLLSLSLVGLTLHAQTAHEEIQALRTASNQALKAGDLEQFLSFLTEDVLLTSGSGNLRSGKDAIRAYVANGNLDAYYWVRTPSEVEVNQELGLAWETGSWKGYKREDDGTPFAGGKYSAMWSRESGSWLIKSELFVALE